jgi:hypothetical protein
MSSCYFITHQQIIIFNRSQMSKKFVNTLYVSSSTQKAIKFRKKREESYNNKTGTYH